MLLNTFWTRRVAIAARIAEEQLYPESWNEIDSTRRLRPDPRQSRVQIRPRSGLGRSISSGQEQNTVIVPRRVASTGTPNKCLIPAVDSGVAGMPAILAQRK